MTEPNPNQESALEAARDLSQLAAVEIVSLHAVDLMTAAAVKLGLFEGGDQMRDLAEARILIDVLAGFTDAAARNIGHHHRKSKGPINLTKTCQKQYGGKIGSDIN